MQKQERDNLNQNNQQGDFSLSNILFQVFGWATLALLAYGVIYTFFIYEEPESAPLDPATYERLKDAYERGELEAPYREGDPYRGSAY